ncbi:MAG: hypothetical protein ACLRNZ_01560 [Blautia massiliensis (ex Durand et al. 2017)]
MKYSVWNSWKREEKHGNCQGIFWIPEVGSDGAAFSAEDNATDERMERDDAWQLSARK